MTTFRSVKHNCPNDLEQFGTEGRYINPRYVEAGRCIGFRIGDVITFCKRFSDLRPWPYLLAQTNPVSAVGMAHILSLEDVCAASPRPLASPRRQFLPAGWAPCDAVTIRAPATQIGSVVETYLETTLETILETIRLARSISARHHCGALPDERATVAHEACDGTVQMDVRISYEASHPSWGPLWGPL
jgi:hypothetical protein